VVESVEVNGDAGLLVQATYPDGARLLAVMAFPVADGRITAVYDQLNPAKLTRVPHPERSRNLLT
jgi:RNA polymerase sigma-70 factor (ECF subfamily)